MAKTFKTRIQVRGYEIDGYGHVNHAVYLNYFEAARWTMIEDSGIGTGYFKKHGTSPVIARAEVDYRAPCFLGDWLRVETTMIELRSRVAVFQQKVFREEDDKLAAEGRMTLVTVTIEGKAVALPADFGSWYGW